MKTKSTNNDNDPIDWIQNDLKATDALGQNEISEDHTKGKKSPNVP